MKTSPILDEVFKRAFPVPFDDDSRFVFFSDVHRGDDSLSDEFGRNRAIYDHALDYYYNKGCTYVEVGDGDELLEHPRFEHIHSAHISTFDLLKRFYDDGRLIKLFGNHDLQLSDPAYVQQNLYFVYDEYTETYEPLFPGITVHEALVMKHRTTGQELFIVHGHQGDLLNDQLWRFSLFMIRYFWRFMHVVGVKYAASPARNRYKRHKVERNYSRWNTRHNIAIICGHTHRPKFPKPDEPSYFNTGCCMHPRGITCLELIDGQITLVSWRMHSKENGILYVKRTIIQGPEPIVHFQGERGGVDYARWPKAKKAEQRKKDTKKMKQLDEILETLQDAEEQEDYNESER